MIAHKAVLIFLTACTLIACGGGGGSSDSNPNSNPPPANGGNNDDDPPNNGGNDNNDDDSPPSNGGGDDDDPPNNGGDDDPPPNNGGNDDPPNNGGDDDPPVVVPPGGGNGGNDDSPPSGGGDDDPPNNGGDDDPPPNNGGDDDSDPGNDDPPVDDEEPPVDDEEPEPNASPSVVIISPTAGSQITNSSVDFDLSGSITDGSVSTIKVSVVKNSSSEEVFSDGGSGTSLDTVWNNLTPDDNGGYTVVATAISDKGEESSREIGITVNIEEEEDPDPFISSVTVSDQAIKNSQLGSKKITVEVHGGGFACVSPSLRPSNGGSVNRPDDFCDNGEGADVEADDGIYTGTFALSDGPFANTEGYMVHVTVSLIPMSENGSAVRNVNAAVKPAFGVGVFSGGSANVTQVSNSMWVTDYVANIIVDSDFNPFNSGDMSEVTSSFCARFGSGFDFLVVQGYERSRVRPGRSGIAYSLTVSNDVEGLGQNVHDRSDSFGCPGLQSRVYLTMQEVSGRSAPHELSHRYAVNFNSSALQLTYDGRRGSTDWNPVHWGHSTLCGGLLYEANCLVDEGGTFSVGPTGNGDTDTGRLNPFEMYTWGLRQADEIDPEWFVTEPGTDASWGTTLDPVNNSAVREVSIYDIQTEYGQRVPAQGQTSYRIGCIVISEERLSDDAMAMESMKCERYGSAKAGKYPITPGGMEWVTHGKATFESKLP